jgi:hypothetical protein
MPQRLWPNARPPQFFSSIGVSYALRARLLNIDRETIHIRCATGENCGANFWVNRREGTAEMRYSLQGAGALYAIAVDEVKELPDISRVGFQLKEGRDNTVRLDFRFTDSRVQKTVIAVRLNEGLREPRERGELELKTLDLHELSNPDTHAPQQSTWLILVPVTIGSPEAILAVHRFAVRDMGEAAAAAGVSAGRSIDEAIGNTIENIVYSRVNSSQMFEMKVSRTADLDLTGSRPIREFYHAGRKYEVYEIPAAPTPTA